MLSADVLHLQNKRGEIAVKSQAKRTLSTFDIGGNREPFAQGRVWIIMRTFPIVSLFPLLHS
jgi:hypothetical protein